MKFCWTTFTLVFTHYTTFCIKNLAQGLVPKVSYVWTSNDQIVVLKVPLQFLNCQRTISAIKKVQTHIKH